MQGSGGITGTGGNINLTSQQGARFGSDDFSGNVSGTGSHRIHQVRSLAGGGGYGTYGIGGGGTLTTFGGYAREGQAGTAGVVIIYEL